MHNPLPPIKRHLFLTGDKQVGKSTLLRRLIDVCQLDCAGFETRAFFLDDRRAGFTLHGRIDMPPYENDCVCFARINERQCVPVLPVLEGNGVQILKGSLASPAPFILMDELGRLERDAHGFIDQLFACLDSEKRCIGVLQKCGSEHVARIAARQDVTVLTVTAENREALLEFLAAQFSVRSK